jgi:hypothetical protein
MKWIKAGMLALTCAVALIACGGKSGGGNAAADLEQAAGAVKEAAGATQTMLEGLQAAAGTRLAQITGSGLKLPEDEVTEADAARIGGWITRGKTNLKLTGPYTDAQLRAAGEAMQEAYKTNKQLFRLDLSATGLTALPNRCFSSFVLSGADQEYLGEVVLPEGIKRLEEGVFADQSNLYAVNLPNSLEYIGSYVFDETVWFPKVVVPLKYGLNGQFGGGYYNAKSFLIPRGGKETTFVFQDGVTAMNLSMFAPESGTVKYVLPPSLKTFFIYGSDQSNGISWIKLERVVELYCYAPVPPAYQPPADYARILRGAGYSSSFSEADTQLCLDIVKTIYVPAGSEKAYEDAWFNYTAAEFKPIPANLATIDTWY